MTMCAVKRRSTERVRVIQDTGDTKKSETFQSGDCRGPEGKLTVQDQFAVFDDADDDGVCRGVRVGLRSKRRF